jgi:hypothetical protein
VRGKGKVEKLISITHKEKASNRGAGICCLKLKIREVSGNIAILLKKKIN